MATASHITDSLAEHVNTLPISENSREELLRCLRDYSESDRDLYVNITGAVQGAQTANNKSHFKDIIPDCIQFASTINTILERVLPDDVRKITNVVMMICQVLFQKTGTNQDIVSRCINGLQHIMDDNMIYECKGIENEILDSISYLKGTPPPNEVSEQDRSIVLSGLGHNLTEKGSKQLDILTNKINRMVTRRSTDMFDVFLQYVELYCSLTVLREILLIYHFAILSAYKSPTANSVKNVLNRHKEKDKSLFRDIRFLLKPTKETLRMHLKYSAYRCEIIQRFLNRHELTEGPSRFYDKALQLFPEKRKNETLSLDSVFGQKIIWCNTISEKENTVFQFRTSTEEAGSIFSIQPLPLSYQHISTGLFGWLSLTNVESSENAKWRLVELEPNAPHQPSSFVIVLASTEDQCIYTGNGGFVYSTRLSDNDSGFFWTLKVL